MSKVSQTQKVVRNPDTLHGGQTRTIGDLCSFANGNGFAARDWSNSGLPIIRIQNLNGSRDFNFFAGEPEERWIVEPGTLLFAWAGVRGVSFGPTIWNGPRGVLNQHIYRIIPNNNIDKFWLYCALQVVTTRIERQAHGFKSSLLHVHKSDITNQEIVVPPLEEQRKIADILSTWDEAIEQQMRLIELKRERKRGLMQQLLTGRVRFKEFEGLEWAELRLVQAYEFTNGRAFKPEEWGSEGLPIIRIQNLTGTQSEFNYFAGDLDPQHKVCKGDFLLSWSATVRGFIWEGADAALNQHIFKVTSKHGFDLKFGYYLINFEISKLMGKVHGTSMKHLTKRDLDKLVTAFPSLPEQHKIAAVPSAADEELDALTAQLEALKEQKRGLMQQLLTGKTRVQVA